VAEHARRNLSALEVGDRPSLHDMALLSAEEARESTRTALGDAAGGGALGLNLNDLRPSLLELATGSACKLSCRNCGSLSTRLRLPRPRVNREADVSRVTDSTLVARSNS
jgi:hypothetical protein